jgi:aryl-alcohol dehydrogenase-like predicted oxidoreductase
VAVEPVAAGDAHHPPNAPRFDEPNLRENLDRFAPLRRFAAERGISRPQLALAWLLAQGEDVVPIPGSRWPQHIDDNLGALDVTLTTDDLAELDRLAPPGLAVGPSLMAPA